MMVPSSKMLPEIFFTQLDLAPYTVMLNTVTKNVPREVLNSKLTALYQVKPELQVYLTEGWAHGQCETIKGTFKVIR